MFPAFPVRYFSRYGAASFSALSFDVKNLRCLLPVSESAGGILNIQPSAVFTGASFNVFMTENYTFLPFPAIKILKNYREPKTMENHEHL